MKNIHFDNLYSKKYYIPVIVVMLVMLFLMISYSGDGEHTKVYSTILSLLSVIIISRSFWYKNYVQHTSSRILIRTNRFSSINLEFDKITEIKHSKTTLEITEKGKIHTIQIESINPEDVQKLVNLLVERSQAQYEDSFNLSYYE
jgi:hypothetical protein